MIPLGSLVSQAVAALVAQAEGGLDHSALLKLIEQFSERVGTSAAGAKDPAGKPVEGPVRALPKDPTRTELVRPAKRFTALPAPL